MASHLKYTAKELTDMLLMYGKCDCNSAKAKRMYAERYPNRACPSASTITAAYARVLENRPIVPTREGFESVRKSKLSVKKEEEILKYFERNSVTSLRGAVREIPGVTLTQVMSVLKREGRTSYAARKAAPPAPHVDEAGRRDFSEWLLERRRRDVNFLESILWTGERIFSNYGLLNKKNLNIWAEEKPTEDELLKTKVPERWGVRVWGAILGDRIYGPIFLPEKLNSHDYLELINGHLTEIIDDLPIETLKKLWFQHDGTPSHCTAPVCERLSELFKKRWIGRKGPVPWPAQSQDLTPIDFFLWTKIKAEVFKRNCDNAKDMRERLRHAFDVIRKECNRRPELMLKILKDVVLRARECVEGSDGKEIEENETQKLEPVANMEAEKVEEEPPEVSGDTWQKTIKSVKSESLDLNSECVEEAEPELTEDTWQETMKSVKSESSDLNSECAEKTESEFTENMIEFMDNVKAEPMEIIYLNEGDISTD